MIVGLDHRLMTGPSKMLINSMHATWSFSQYDMANIRWICFPVSNHMYIEITCIYAWSAPLSNLKLKAWLTFYTPLIIVNYKTNNICLQFISITYWKFHFSWLKSTNHFTMSQHFLEKKKQIYMGRKMGQTSSNFGLDLSPMNNIAKIKLCEINEIKGWIRCSHGWPQLRLVEVGLNMYTVHQTWSNRHHSQL